MNEQLDIPAGLRSLVKLFGLYPEGIISKAADEIEYLSNYKEYLLNRIDNLEAEIQYLKGQQYK